MKTIRIEVVHDDGTRAVYEVTEIVINEPVVILSEAGGTVAIRPVREES